MDLWCDFFLIILTIAFLLVNSKENVPNHIYCVDRLGSTSCSCLVNECCTSLSLLVDELNASCVNISRPSQIIIEIHSDLILNDTIHFENFCGCCEIEIRGVSNPSITCLKNENGEMDAGLYFKNVGNLIMSGLSFLNCGSLQESTSPVSYTHLTLPTIYSV